MFLRYKLPIEVDVVGPSTESLNLDASFNDGELFCKLNINCDQATALGGTQDNSKYFSSSKEFTINIIDSKNQKLPCMIQEEHFLDLARLLCSVANRFIKAIRNFGIVAHLHEVNFEEKRPEMTLRRWNVETSINNNDWTPICSKSFDMVSYLAYLSVSNQNCPEIKVANWEIVQQAVLNDTVSPPEREFTTNSVEHLHLGNLRLAVVESVIGLEIVLTRFLGQYLKVYKDLSNERIKEFLSPDFGLTSRIAGVLHLTLSKKDIQKIDLTKVRKVVKWRNGIVHRTGHLPTDVSKEDVSDCIIQVISLSLFLGYKVDSIASTSEALHLGFFPFGLPLKKE